MGHHAGPAAPLSDVDHGVGRHPWAVSVREAIDLQARLRDRVIRVDRFDRLSTVAGVDVAYGRRGRSVAAQAAVAIFDFETQQPLEQATATLAVDFPYVPGLLTFREAPAALAALARLRRPPDLLLCDGQGVAHPRRIGFASHLGLYLDIPSIGVAKSRLIGEHAEPGPARGDRTPLLDGDEVIGAVIRTRAGAKPLYVSIGHRVGLETAVALVLRFAGRFRLPEPIRMADRLSKAPRPAD